jgi:phospholipase/carboxylesterase
MVDRDAVVIESQGRADAVVILMHGLGADGHDFEPLVPELGLPATLCVRWVFPQAPIRPVTINGGYHMRAWYDIFAIDPDAPEDEAGIREAASAIGAHVRSQRDQGIQASRIILAGFSQGGAMALFTALRWPERLAGVVAMSCYLPLSTSLSAEAHPSNRDLPVFMAHGTVDPVVPFSLGEAARDLLRTQDYSVAWHAYNMQHTVCDEEITDLREWLLGALAGSSR